MRRDARPSVTPQLVIGLALMTLGVLLMLDRLDVLSAAAGLLAFWPAGLIALGANLLARRTDAHGRFWGGAWIVLGAWLLLTNLGIVRVGFWELLWPLVLVFIGVNLIRQTMRRPGSAQRHASASGHLFAVLAESKRTVSGEPFEGASMTACMGSCELDLRQALFAPGQEAVVDVFGLMSSHELYVPSGWVVVPDVVQFLAEINDKRLPVPVDPAVAPIDAPPRIVLRGFLMMAGITVKN